MATFTFLPIVTLTGCATTNNSNLVTVANSAVGSLGICIGAVLSHANLPEGTTVTGFNSTTQITVSNNATASGTGLSIVATNPSFIDFDSIGAVIRTGSDVYNINGAHLRINGDVRFGKNTTPDKGPFGNVVMSATDGGQFTIDAENVRWLAFTGGSGSIPTAGTIISRLGVSGELIGVWKSDMQGGAQSGTMPVTGFIKFKSVTGGAFTSGVLTGITATASGADVLGWIEVVGVEASNISCRRLNKFVTKGGWFDLGTTTGDAGQIIQCPATSANTFFPGVWIETATPGQYEFYPSLNNNTNGSWNTTQRSTDARNKFVEHLTWGQLRIGSNGTNNIGFVPPSGRKIRIPNIILMNTNTTITRSVNAVPHATVASRYDFGTGADSGYFDINHTIGCWYFLVSTPYFWRIRNTATFDIMSVTNSAEKAVFETVGIGIYSNFDSVPFTAISCTGGLDIKNCTFGRGGVIGTTDYTVSLQYCVGVTIENTLIYKSTRRTAAATGYNLYMIECIDININGLTVLGNYGIYLVTVSDAIIKNIIYADELDIETSTANGAYILGMTTLCSNIEVDGISLFPGITNCHPHVGIATITRSKDIKIRNIGTPTNRFNCGSANQTGLGIVDGGNNTRIREQRIYLTALRTTYTTAVATSSNRMMESIWCDYNNTANTANLVAANFLMADTILKSCELGRLFVYAAFASCFGSIFYDLFVNNRTGRIGVNMNEPTPKYLPNVATTLNPNSGFTATGILSTGVLDDEVIWTWPHFIKGHSNLAGWHVQGASNTYANTTLAIDNHQFWYDIDVGNGFTNTWYELTTYVIKGWFTAGSDIVTVVSGETANLNIGDTLVGASTGLPVNPTIIEIISATQVRIDTNAGTTRSNVDVRFMQLGNHHGQTINPSIGFRVKLRVKTRVAALANQIQSFYLTTHSDSSTTVRENGYNLDSVEAQLKVIGLNDGSEVRVYRASDGQEIGGIESSTGGEFILNYTWVGLDFAVNVIVFHLNYLPISFNGVILDESGETLLVQQSIDRQYFNPA